MVNPVTHLSGKELGEQFENVTHEKHQNEPATHRGRQPRSYRATKLRREDVADVAKEQTTHLHVKRHGRRLCSNDLICALEMHSMRCVFPSVGKERMELNEFRSRSSKRTKEIKDVKDLMKLSLDVDRQCRESMSSVSELKEAVQLRMLAVRRMTLKTLWKQFDLQRNERLAVRLTSWCEYKYEEENEKNESLRAD